MFKFLHKALLPILFAAFASQASAMFVQPDTYDVTVPGVGTNRYAYSSDDPVNLSDPGGHVPDNWATSTSTPGNDSHGFHYTYDTETGGNNVSYTSWTDHDTVDSAMYYGTGGKGPWGQLWGTIGAAEKNCAPCESTTITYQSAYSNWAQTNGVAAPSYIDYDIALLAAGPIRAGIGIGAAINLTKVAPDSPLLAGALRETAEASKLALANIGPYNFSVGEFTREQTQVMGEAWVGNGYSVTSRGFLESADGLRQFRPPSLKNSPFATTGIQANLSQRLPGMTEWISNGHVNVVP